MEKNYHKSKKKLILNRDEPRTKYLSVSQSINLKNQESFDPLRKIVGRHRLTEMEEKQNNVRATKIRNQSNKRVRILVNRRSGSVAKETISKNKADQINCEKGREVHEQKKLRDPCQSSPIQLFVQQYFAVIKSADSKETEQKKFNLNYNAMVVILKAFQKWLSKQNTICRRQFSIEKTMQFTVYQHKSQKIITPMKMERCIDVNILPKDKYQHLQISSKLVHQQFQWKPKIEENSLQWQMCLHHEKQYTQEELACFGRKINAIKQKKQALDRIEIEVLEKNRICLQKNIHLKELKNHLETLRQQQEQYNKKFKARKKLAPETESELLRRGADRYKKTEQQMLMMAPSLQRSTLSNTLEEKKIAGEEIKKNRQEIDKLFQSINSMSLSNINWMDLYQRKRNLSNTCQSMNIKLCEIITSKNNVIDSYFKLLKKFLDSIPSRKRYLQYLNQDMHKVVSQLNQLMFNIEHELPNVVPILNQNLPIVKYYKELQYMLHKLMSFYRDVNAYL